MLLVHDFLLSKGGIALSQSHGLRASIDRHKARLGSELTRARLRRKCASIDALRTKVESESRSGPVYPRWIRVNTLKSSVGQQLETTFSGLDSVRSIKDVMSGVPNTIRVDGNIPNLVAVAPDLDYTKTDAYKAGAIILQDKASCFPAYLLDPRPEDGDVIDACSAPGNKTTHLAAILHSRGSRHRIHAFEKDKNRAKTLEKMIQRAGSDPITTIHPGQDFLRTNPDADEFRNVGALLLDPSCSGSGIVGRDEMPDLHLPRDPKDGKGKGDAKKPSRDSKESKKRKREGGDEGGKPPAILVDDDGETTVLASEQDLKVRIEALASFQLLIVQHAMRFPAARKITYSTCSLYAGENEHVTLKALDSDIAKERGWRPLLREHQVRGLRDWPVRGSLEACDGRQDVADACIRSYMNDGRGAMGFFVVGFVRDVADEADAPVDEDPFVRDERGMIIRDPMGIPTLKATGQKAVDLYGGDSPEDDEVDEDGESVDEYLGVPSDDENIPAAARPAAAQLPNLRIEAPSDADQPREATSGYEVDEDEDDSSDEWSGFDD